MLSFRMQNQSDAIVALLTNLAQRLQLGQKKYLRIHSIFLAERYGRSRAPSNGEQPHS